MADKHAHTGRAASKRPAERTKRSQLPRDAVLLPHRFVPLDARATALIASGIGLAAFALYFVTLAPGITWRFRGADSGDMASAVATWGIPHPTGYPLYVVIGGLVSHLLPVGEIAYRLNLFSAFSSAGADVFVFLAVLRLSSAYSGLPVTLRYLAAATAALALAASRTLWSQSVLAEVYAFQMLFAGAIAWLLADDRRDRRQLLALALLCGLALTHHRTIVFSIAGAVVVVVWRFRRQLLDARLLGALGLAFLAPLSLYLLLPWRAGQHPASNWYDPTTLDRFVDLVTASRYSSYLHHNPADIVGALPAVARLTLGQFAWWMLPLAVVGCLELWERDAAYVGYIVVVIALCAVFYSQYIADGRERYLLQAYVVIAVAAGVGMMAALAWMMEALEARGANYLPIIASLAAGITVIPWAIVGLRAFDLSGDRTAWNYAVATLNAAPPSATLYVDTDERTFALWYGQRVAHLRPDVTVVTTGFKDPAHQR